MKNKTPQVNKKYYLTDKSEIVGHFIKKPNYSLFGFFTFYSFEVKFYDEKIKPTK
jgi:hypothetical protein